MVKRAFMLTALCLLLCPGVALAQSVPSQMSHQGVVRVDGLPFNGTGLFRFALIDPDTNENLWSNDGSIDEMVGGTPTDAVSLTVDTGLYSVRLGNTGLTNMTTIPIDVFADDNPALRVWFDDGVNGVQQLTPDLPLTPAPFASRLPEVIVNSSGNVEATGTIKAGSSITIDGSTDTITATSGTIDFDDENLTTSGLIESTAAGFKFPDTTIQTTAAVPDGDTLAALSCASGQIAKWNGAAWICAADDSGAGGASTLDEAYDGGGAGAGRIITADAGAVQIDGAGGLVVAGTIQAGSSITIDGVANTITSSADLEAHVGSGRALRLEANATSPNVIGGHPGNIVTAGALGATIGGGGQGAPNNNNNRVTDDYGTIGGGMKNQAGDNDADLTNKRFATAGGFRSTVPGGSLNRAGGDYSFAAGRQATVRDAAATGDADGDEGTFVWCDSTGSPAGRCTSTGPDQFIIQANGGVGIGTTTPGAKLDVDGDVVLQNGVAVDEFSTDGTLGGKSDTAVPTERAVKTYVDAQVGGASGAPIGTVVAWLKNLPSVPALSAGWVECNGQVLADAGSPLNGQTIPDLNANRFLRGSATSGTTGGSSTHVHSGETGIMNSGGSQGNGSGLGTLRHTHSFTTAGADLLPPYYEVVWIIKVK